MQLKQNNILGLLRSSKATIPKLPVHSQSYEPWVICKEIFKVLIMKCIYIVYNVDVLNNIYHVNYCPEYIFQLEYCPKVI